jgi:hypothetical protein
MGKPSSQWQVLHDYMPATFERYDRAATFLRACGWAYPNGHEGVELKAFG